MDSSDTECWYCCSFCQCHWHSSNVCMFYFQGCNFFSINIRYTIELINGNSPVHCQVQSHNKVTCQCLHNYHRVCLGDSSNGNRYSHCSQCWYVSFVGC